MQLSFPRRAGAFAACWLPGASRAALRSCANGMQVAKHRECTRITPMDKEELKERVRVPLLGFSAVLISIVAFLLLLYAITVVIRFFFALGSLG